MAETKLKRQSLSLGQKTYEASITDGSTTTGAIALITGGAVTIDTPTTASDIIIMASGRFSSSVADDEMQLQIWNNTDSAEIATLNHDFYKASKWMCVSVTGRLANITASKVIQLRWARVAGSGTLTVYNCKMQVITVPLL